MLLVLPPPEPFDANILPRHPSTKRVYYECNLDLFFDAKSKSGDRIDTFVKLLKDDFSEYNPDNIIIEIQYNIIQILTIILLYDNTAHKLRSELLRSACGAMNTLSELLNSPHEFIRNACVILLSHLSQNDPSIQKLIAFDGAFERVLSIIDAEDGVYGGVVVMDCLLLMERLLLNNESNQKYFVEIGCVAKLQSLLEPKDFENA